MRGRDGAEEELSRKLDVLILLAAAKVGEGKPVSERVPLLDKLGLTRAQIAAVCDTTPEIVSVRLSEARRRKRERRTQVERDDG